MYAGGLWEWADDENIIRPPLHNWLVAWVCIYTFLLYLGVFAHTMAGGRGLIIIYQACSV